MSFLSGGTADARNRRPLQNKLAARTPLFWNRFSSFHADESSSGCYAAGESRGSRGIMAESTFAQVLPQDELTVPTNPIIKNSSVAAPRASPEAAASPRRRLRRPQLAPHRPAAGGRVVVTLGPQSMRLTRRATAICQRAARSPIRRRWTSLRAWWRRRRGAVNGT